MVGRNVDDPFMIRNRHVRTEKRDRYSVCSFAGHMLRFLPPYGISDTFIDTFNYFEITSYGSGLQ